MRVELNGGALLKITSLKEFRERVGNVTVGELEPAGYSLERLARDGVPNRHAALHGFISYSSMQNSLNMLFMTDFIFGAIDAVKRLSEKRADATAENLPRN